VQLCNGGGGGVDGGANRPLGRETPQQVTGWTSVSVAGTCPSCETAPISAANVLAPACACAMRLPSLYVNAPVYV
jgi:hypothetical protein